MRRLRATGGCKLEHPWVPFGAKKKWEREVKGKNILLIFNQGVCTGLHFGKKRKYRHFSLLVVRVRIVAVLRSFSLYCSYLVNDILHIIFFPSRIILSVY